MHVVEQGGRWLVRRSGAVRASKAFGSSDGAMAWAKGRADVVYRHAADGRIAERIVISAEIARQASDRRAAAMARLVNR